MNTTERTTGTWTRVAATAALAGAVSWLVKQGAIAATLRPDGTPSENLLIAVLYLMGAALLGRQTPTPTSSGTAPGGW